MTEPGPPPGAPNAGGPLDPLSERDNVVSAFQIDDEPVRGRITRLGATVDAVLGAHDYPDCVAQLLGEAILISVLIGHSLKFDGKLIVQASGGGPVNFLVADYNTSGGVRGFAQFDADRVREIELDVRAPGAQHLLGDATLAFTIDQGADFDRYQSLAAIDGPSLGDVAEGYFRRSEQVPTKLKLSVARTRVGAAPPVWRAGGALLQKIAPDAARGETDEAWEKAGLLFDTLKGEELVDPDLSSAQVLFRLFHEDGVRVFAPTVVEKRCACSTERIARVLASFPHTEIEDMVETDGRVRVTCEYCNSHFSFTLEDIAAVRD